MSTFVFIIISIHSLTNMRPQLHIKAICFPRVSGVSSQETKRVLTPPAALWSPARRIRLSAASDICPSAVKPELTVDVCVWKSKIWTVWHQHIRAIISDMINNEWMEFIFFVELILNFDIYPNYRGDNTIKFEYISEKPHLEIKSCTFIKVTFTCHFQIICSPTAAQSLDQSDVITGDSFLSPSRGKRRDMLHWQI